MLVIFMLVIFMFVIFMLVIFMFVIFLFLQIICTKEKMRMMTKKQRINYMSNLGKKLIIFAQV